MRTSTEVIELVIEDGQVLRVVARDGAGTKRIRARLGVVLATGGYDWNSEYVRTFDDLPETGSMVPLHVAADHIAMAAKADAIHITARYPSQRPIFTGKKIPQEEPKN